MLSSIQIHRFKSIVDQRIEFGRVNLFVGGNGSGKSNLLEALGVTSSALARGVTDIDLVSKGVRLSTPSFFKSAFKNRKLPSTFRIEAVFSDRVKYDFELVASDNASHLRFKTESAMIRSRREFGRSGNGATAKGFTLKTKPNESRGLYDQLRSFADFPAAMVREFDEFARFAIYSPQTEFLRGTEVGSAQTPPVGLHGEQLPLATASLIEYWHRAEPEEREYLDSVFDLVWSTGWTNQFRTGKVPANIMSPQIKTGADTLYFRDRHMHTRRNTVTAYDSSEGVLFLLFMVVLVAHPEAPNVFALDNIDSALNPRMTKYAVSKIIETARKAKPDGSNPNQVFMTSHNPTAMDAIDIFDEDTRIFTVSRNADGHSIVSRVAPPSGITRAEWIRKSAGRSMSELWIGNEIPGALGDEFV